MKHATSRELFEYWDRVRHGEKAPRRSAIEPSDLRRILADTFILEVADREKYVVRLAGTRICGAYCRELKGTNFLDLFEKDDRSAVATLGTAVAEDGAGAVLTISAATARQKNLSFEMLMLPLRHGTDSFDRLLGSFAPFDRPYWLGTEPVVRQTVTSLRLVWPDEKPHFMRRASDRKEPSLIPFPVDGGRRRGHLYVLDGGKD
jgi:hypothetical protein